GGWVVFFFVWGLWVFFCLVLVGCVCCVFVCGFCFWFFCGVCFVFCFVLLFFPHYGEFNSVMISEVS
ncbi:hypothetical protein, partial [Escherichia coli]|uniref:hypothetical protein n=1 Tax=Escherichia coli TaxID=562 RepID=UPI001BC89D96